MLRLNRMGGSRIQQLWQRSKRNAQLQFSGEKTTRSLSRNSNQVAYLAARKQTFKTQ